MTELDSTVTTFLAQSTNSSTYVSKWIDATGKEAESGYTRDSNGRVTKILAPEVENRGSRMVRKIKIMVDYNADLPLWFDEPSDPSLLLSEELLQDLQDWQRWFDLHYDEGRGWDSASSGRAHTKWGESLRSRVSGELGPDVEIDLHTWTKMQP